MAELLSTLAEATLSSGMSIVFEAIDPTTGAAVTGVKVSNIGIYGDTPDDTTSPAAPEPTAPLFVPLPQEG